MNRAEAARAAHNEAIRAVRRHRRRCMTCLLAGHRVYRYCAAGYELARTVESRRRALRNVIINRKTEGKQK